MDSYLFKANVERCRNVVEATRYLEMFSYLEPNYNTIEDHPLSVDELHNFVHMKGGFDLPPSLSKKGIKPLAGIRLIYQPNAQHPDTFTPHVLSLKNAEYIEMVEGMNLPRRGIESTSCVGPLFWSDIDPIGKRLQIVYRKSDVRKKGKTRGWEMMLSHDFQTGVTSGYCKGTPGSDIVECINHLKVSLSDVIHPLLLPVIILSHDISFREEIKQRDARDLLRRLERALSMRTEIWEKGDYVNEVGVVDLDTVNRHLIECHAQVLWKRPVAYLRVLEAIFEAMALFCAHLPEDRELNFPQITVSHAVLWSRLRFIKMRLEGIESYADTTLARIEIQRSALSSIISQKQSELDFRIAGEQRKVAVASKREGTSMKMLSLLATVFLPGAYIASILSTSFFDFQTSADSKSEVSPRFWIYWAVTIPSTLIIVTIWYIWERRREAKFELEDRDLEREAVNLESMIMDVMRKRTMSKAATWDTTKRETTMKSE